MKVFFSVSGIRCATNRDELYATVRLCSEQEEEGFNGKNILKRRVHATNILTFDPQLTVIQAKTLIPHMLQDVKNMYCSAIRDAEIKYRAGL